MFVVTSLARLKRRRRRDRVYSGGRRHRAMAAVLAHQTPGSNTTRGQIGDVANCLNKMGARISGVGTSTIVEGVTRLATCGFACCWMNRNQHLRDGGNDRRRVLLGPDRLSSTLDHNRWHQDFSTRGIRVKPTAPAAPVDVTTQPFGIPDRPPGAADGADEQARAPRAARRSSRTVPCTSRLAGSAPRIQLDGETAPSIDAARRP